MTKVITCLHLQVNRPEGATERFQNARDKFKSIEEETGRVVSPPGSR